MLMGSEEKSMKLVEILARELKEWPEGQATAWQSAFDLEIYFEGLDWDGMVYATEAADDRGHPNDGVGVTREMWEAERSRLAGPGWSGEGLPKAGELVDAPVNGARYMCEVLAVEGDDIAVRIPGAVRVVDISAIKPVRTQRQIEAEKRMEAVAKMCSEFQVSPDSMGAIRMACLHLYDAGYRKQDQQK